MSGKRQIRNTFGRVIVTVAKSLYIALFAVALLVVVLFAVYKLAVKPPEVDQNVEVTLPANPNASGVGAIIDAANDKNKTEQTSPEPTAPVEPEVITLERKEDFFTFLLVGVDDGNGNADTIMVVSYDVANGKVNALSVPRDTLVNVSRNTKKINAAYGMGGVEQLMDEVTGLIGFRPDHYLKVDIRGFKAIVNQLGGVSFYVPEDMYHEDGAGFTIDLKEGSQWLDGNQALQLVRYRGYANADLGRIQTQQKFLQQLAKQLVKRSSVSDIDDYANILATYLDTDLSVTELVWFGSKALYLDFGSDIGFHTLPGDGQTKYGAIRSYYGLYADEARAMINATVNPYTTDIPAQLQDILTVN